MKVCKKVTVKNADKNNGDYVYVSNIKADWEPDTPVYKHVDQNKYIFRNVTWMIGDEKDLSSIKALKRTYIKPL